MSYRKRRDFTAPFFIFVIDFKICQFYQKIIDKLLTAVKNRDIFKLISVKTWDFSVRVISYNGIARINLNSIKVNFILPILKPILNFITRRKNK